jgi:hypothetical protein
VYNTSFGGFVANNSIEKTKPGHCVKKQVIVSSRAPKDFGEIGNHSSGQSYFRSYGKSNLNNKVDSAVTSVTEKPCSLMLFKEAAGPRSRQSERSAVHQVNVRINRHNEIMLDDSVIGTFRRLPNSCIEERDGPEASSAWVKTA